MFKEKKTRDAVMGGDVMGPKIGGDVGDERPREQCPGCKTPQPRQLGVADFPGEHAPGVQQAMADGADFYECRSCAKRWAVVRKRVQSSDGVVSLEPARRQQRRPGGMSRKMRRAHEAHNARLIRKNEALAGADAFVPTERVVDADAARKARNKRKAARK